MCSTVCYTPFCTQVYSVQKWLWVIILTKSVKSFIVISEILSRFVNYCRRYCCYFILSSCPWNRLCCFRLNHRCPHGHWVWVCLQSCGHNTNRQPVRMSTITRTNTNWQHVRMFTITWTQYQLTAYPYVYNHADTIPTEADSQHVRVCWILTWSMCFYPFW